jgi:hypothetical protein
MMDVKCTWVSLINAPVDGSRRDNEPRIPSVCVPLVSGVTPLS